MSNGFPSHRSFTQQREQFLAAPRPSAPVLAITLSLIHI